MYNTTMVFKIILILAIITQFIAAGIAISLIRKTKYNASWMLLTAGFLVQAIRLFVEYLPVAGMSASEDTAQLMAWSAIFMAFFFVVGVFYIQKIFKHMRRMEMMRRHSEKILLNAIIQAEEKERKRFAKDIHDGLGPLLSTIKMSISSLSHLKENEQTMNIVHNTELVIDEAVKSLKEISNNLSPHVLDNFGLMRAIQSFVNKINALKLIDIKLNSNFGKLRFSKDKETVLYRVVCELVNNTIKHANATEINIELDHSDNLLSVTYQDDGIGVDAGKVEDYMQNGMGISNIFSRISSLDGTIEIDSEPNNGLKVYIKVEV